MIVKETSDINDIKAILSNAEIYGRIKRDGETKITLLNIPINDNYRYIAGYEEGIIFALCIFCKKGDVNIVHFQVLPEYRLKLAEKFARKCLDFKGTSPLFAVTPECYRPVINFAKKIGFEFYGIHEETFVKNDKEYRQIITRFRE